MPWKFASITLILASAAAASTLQPRPQNASGKANSAPASRIVGTWRGNSVCAVKNSPCRDEVNIYRFSEIPGKPGRFSVTASKLVDGKEIMMGTGEWTYEPRTRTLETQNPAGRIRLVLQGPNMDGSANMDGSFNLPDDSVYRRIHLQKDK